MADILPVGPQDMETCANIIRESFATVARELGLTVENAPTNGAFLQADRLLADYDKGLSMFCLYEQGIPAGFVALERHSPETVYLEKLAVLPAFRHRGFGAQLLQFSIDQSRTWGSEKISIGIIEENTRLKNWYLTHGFTHTGTRIYPQLPFVVGYMEYPIG